MTAVAPSLQFDPETHVYTLNGAVIPSVTQVISSILPGWQASEWHMQRGTAMHHGCRLMDEGRLDWSTVAPEIEGRLRAWEKFRAEGSAVVVACEKALYHPLYRFAGTLDRILSRNNEIAVADIKSTIAPQVKIQLGFYSLLWTANTKEKLTHAVAVELSDEGSYRTLWLDSPELRLAERTALAALTIFNFKAQEKLQ